MHGGAHRIVQEMVIKVHEISFLHHLEMTTKSLKNYITGNCGNKLILFGIKFLNLRERRCNDKSGNLGIFLTLVTKKCNFFKISFI